MIDCDNIVNYNECCLYHFECNGCMDCKDYVPKPSAESDVSEEK